MIIAVEDLMAMVEFVGQSEKILQQKLNAVEQLIRTYTNKYFQTRYDRFFGNSLGYRIFGTYQNLAVGDTIQITQSDINDGLYTITELGDTYIRLDKNLLTNDFNLVTKVEYPDDVIAGVLNLMIWEVQNRQKVGVKSETLSSHSVTYFVLDANISVMGYPIALLGFLEPYKKARF